MQKLEKGVQVDGIGQPGKGACGDRNGPEKISAGLRQPAANLPNLQDPLGIHLLPVLIRRVRHELLLPVHAPGKPDRCRISGTEFPGWRVAPDDHGPGYGTPPGEA